MSQPESKNTAAQAENPASVDDQSSASYQVNEDLDIDLLDALREAEEHAAQLGDEQVDEKDVAEQESADTQANASVTEKGSEKAGQSDASPSAKAQVEKLQKEIQKHKKDAEHMREAMIRAKADLENARRRFEREQKESQLYAAERTIKAMIPVVDDLDLALANAKEIEAGSMAEGVQLVHRKFLQALEAQGAKTFYPIGEAFDPSSHEALMEMESEEVEAGHIVQVFQRGWTLNTRLLRPAKVIIAK